jgi:uncharacterized protein (TIGR03435 family)
MSRARLTAAAFCLLTAIPGAQQPAFDVASIRPNTSERGIPFIAPPPDGINVVNRPLESLVRSAYGMPFFRIIGMPAWANEERFDIVAKAARPITDSERQLMLRSLLIDRFGLKTHVEQREHTVYVMTRIRADALGPGLKPRTDCAGPAAKCVSGGSAIPSAGRLSLSATTIEGLANGLVASVLERTVVNESKLEGHFDVELSWRPDTAGADDTRPSFFTAVEEQLGMKLTAQRRPVDVLVIDSLERPRPN